jgi:succinate dehydrogenase / fumarate reductase, membrane anchor subunit
MTHDHKTMRSPLARIRYLGSARSGTRHFWQQRLTAVASIPLTLAFIVIVMSLIGSNQAGAVRVLGSPMVAIIMILFIWTYAYHMWLGMQVIIEDYVHDEIWKLASLMGNTFFCFAIALVSLYALLKISFGL